jgi:4-amino-4-deoxy-L-arabinose transferase-like glycosyltransferase
MCRLSFALARDSQTEGRESSRWYRTLALGWVLALTLVRLVLVAPLPLGNGEAYYYAWSRFLDWSYYDHPPLLAWMVRVTTTLRSSPTTVRLAPVLAAACFGHLAYRLAERLFEPRAAFFALVLLTGLPVFLVSSFVVNPEAMLAPLWVAFLLAFESMRERDEWYWPMAAGAFLGLAFLAKYTAVLLVPAALLYAGCARPMRRWLERPSFYAGGALALLITLPVLVWNHARGWPSVHLHLLERTGAAATPVAGENRVSELVALSSSSAFGWLGNLERVLVGQIMAYSPILAPLLMMALVRSIRRVRRDERDLFVTAFTLPILLPLLAFMVKVQDAEPHWTMMALVPAALAAGRWAAEPGLGGTRVRMVALAGVVLTGALFLLVMVHARSAALMRLIPADNYAPRADMINELVGWDDVRAAVKDAVSAAPGEVSLASTHSSLCGRLLFETADHPFVYCPTARRSAFDFFGRRDPPAASSVVVLTSDIREQLPVALRDRACALFRHVDIERGERRVARYFVYSCSPHLADSGAHASPSVTTEAPW